MLWIVYTSFRTQASIFTGQVFSPLNDYTLENYQTILSVTDFPPLLRQLLQDRGRRDPSSPWLAPFPAPMD